jgi:hypothetical protein
MVSNDPLPNIQAMVEPKVKKKYKTKNKKEDIVVEKLVITT